MILGTFEEVVTGLRAESPIMRFPGVDSHTIVNLGESYYAKLQSDKEFKITKEIYGELLKAMQEEKKHTRVKITVELIK